MRFLKFSAPILLAISTLGFAQNKTNNSEVKNYIVFDESKSLPGNLVIDKLNFLQVNSANIQLPSDAVDYLNSVESDGAVGQKLTWARLNKLRILYNDKISNSDKEFVINYLLEQNDEMYEPIFPFLKEFLDNKLK